MTIYSVVLVIVTLTCLALSQWNSLYCTVVIILSAKIPPHLKCRYTTLCRHSHADLPRTESVVRTETGKYDEEDGETRSEDLRQSQKRRAMVNRFRKVHRTSLTASSVDM